MFFRNHLEQKSNSGGLDYRYFLSQGVPFRGSAPLVNSDEYSRLTRRMATAKTGIFDARDPEQVHHGRTLQEVLEAARRQEYEIFRYEEYNNGVAGNDPNQPPALFIWLVWFEKYDILNRDVTSTVAKAQTGK